MTSCYRNRYYIYIYNCTRIYIVNYRQSITLYIIYIGGHFSVARVGESHKRPQKDEKKLFVVVLNITMYSLDVNTSVVRTIASDKGQERRYPWETCHTVCSVFGLWLPDFQSSQHCQEQWTGVTSSSMRI